MTPNNNLSILPFYTRIYPGKTIGRIMPSGRCSLCSHPDRKILPFQILREHRANAVTSVLLKTMGEPLLQTLLSQLVSNGMVVRSYASYGYDIIVSALLLTTETPEGRYYLQITDGVETWYSEIFTWLGTLEQLPEAILQGLG